MINHTNLNQKIKALTSYVTLQLALFVFPVAMIQAAATNDSENKGINTTPAFVTPTPIGTRTPIATLTPIPTIIPTGTVIPTIIVTRTPIPTIIPQDDQYEPNDSIQYAFDLTSHQNVWLDTIDGLGVANDDDYYCIDIPTVPAELTIDCQFTHANGDVDIQVVYESGNVWDFSSSANDNELIEGTITTAGYYYIRVYNRNGGSLDSKYNLLWNTVTQATPTPIPTIIVTRTPIPTIIVTRTPTPTITPIGTLTPIPTIIGTRTPVPTIIVTRTPVPTIIVTHTPIPTITPIGTLTPIPTIIGTRTPVPTIIVTRTPVPTIIVTHTPIPTITPIGTLTPIPTIIGTRTPVPTIIGTRTPTPTITPTVTPTPDPLTHLLGEGDDPSSDVNADGFISIADYIYFIFE